MRSIIVKDLKVCYVCGRTDQVEVHHCIHGTANRKLSTKYHLLVGLCPDHHRGTNGVHGKYGHELDQELKRLAQEKWEGKHGTREEFIKIFGKSYL
jgi:hypothetical protein